jgi:hypothetical protein
MINQLSQYPIINNNNLPEIAVSSNFEGYLVFKKHPAGANDCHRLA